MANNRSILIVDDDEADRYLLSRDLEAIDYSGKIFEAEDGRHALDFLSDFDENKQQHGDTFPPDVIFLDVNMPVMNGLEFLVSFAGIRRIDDRYKSVVVMMLSSSSQTEDIFKSSKYEFVSEYMVKDSYDLDKLKALLIEP